MRVYMVIWRCQRGLVEPYNEKDRCKKVMKRIDEGGQ